MNLECKNIYKGDIAVYVSEICYSNILWCNDVFYYCDIYSKSHVTNNRSFNVACLSLVI